MLIINKHRTLMTYLSLGKIRVGVNLAVDGLVLPSHVMTSGRDSSYLHLSTEFDGDLVIHKDKIVAVLSFNGQPFTCVIPLNSIWSLRIIHDPNVDCMPSQEELDEEFYEGFEDCLPLSMRDDDTPSQ